MPMSVPWGQGVSVMSLHAEEVNRGPEGGSNTSQGSTFLAAVLCCLLAIARTLRLGARRKNETSPMHSNVDYITAEKLAALTSWQGLPIAIIG